MVVRESISILKNILHFFSRCVKIALGEFETILTKPKGEKTKLRRIKMKKYTTLYLTRGALIAALYVSLTYASSLFGLSSGAIQFRLSEMLCILPIFMPEAVIGLTLGCLIANLLTGAVVWDIIFGSIATLIGAVGARLLSRLQSKFLWAATIPTVISNAVIVPFVLIYAYGAPDAYPYLMLTVGVGEVVCAGIFGSLLCYSLKKSKFF